MPVGREARPSHSAPSQPAKSSSHDSNAVAETPPGPQYLCTRHAQAVSPVTGAGYMGLCAPGIVGKIQVELSFLTILFYVWF